MRIADLLQNGPTLSFELFPPRTDDALVRLRATVDDLAGLGPTFMSVTYGALGSTRSRTRDLVIELDDAHPFPVMPHLTAVGSPREDLVALLDAYAEAGIANLLALGGDPPQDGNDLGDLRHASDLVDLARSHSGRFSIGVAAHPEVHPRSVDREEDRRHLAAKLAEADFAITQFFFDVEDYVRLLDELVALGVDKPIIPGVMPIASAAGLRRMAAMNGTNVPAEVDRRLDLVADDPVQLGDLAVEVAVDLGRRLLAAGAPGLHLYALNRSDLVTRVVSELGIGDRRSRNVIALRQRGPA